MKIQLISLILLATGINAFAAPSFGKAMNHPNIGLKFAPLERAKARPLPMPDAHAYLIHKPGDLNREDRFEPYQLWYHNQCEGRWQNTEGSSLIIGRISQSLPIFTEEHVSREEFEVIIADNDRQIDGKKPEQIHEWVASFVGDTVYEPEKLNINSIALSAVYRYPCDASDTLIYAFHPRRIGNARNFDWFCVVLKVVGVTEIKQFQLDFEDLWISKIAQPTSAEKNEGIGSKQLDTSRKGKTDFDQPYHPVRIAARKSIENYDNWWFAETDGYIILSDVNTDLGKSLVERVQKNIPILQDAYRKLLPPMTSTRDISLIRIFQFKSDYNAYVGEKLKWSGGIWMPRRRELALTQEFHTEEIMSTLRHESFHQYISYAWGMLTSSPWLNEGHACFFENAHIDSKGQISFPEDPERLSVLIDNLDSAVAIIPNMFNMSYEDFYHGGGTAAGRSFNYALAWGLAYYLQKGAPRERNTPFKEILPSYTAALESSRNYHEADALTFADVDMKVFQSNFREFWLKRRASAMQYDPLEKD